MAPKASKTAEVTWASSDHSVGAPDNLEERVRDGVAAPWEVDCS